ncbi:sensor histidine kinase [Cohnella sp. JJ-181]|uniref:sensor histidine kinase n=1 Tax=Cohnella rhizoplanae TaxID=2974897 RepID=UPI00232EF2B5|nr:ATP-binding protein [Cohnella sp. JJ-181]
MDGEWIVTGIDARSAVMKTGLQEGARILTIDGKDVAAHPSVQKWRTVDQAENIVVYQNNQTLSINFKDMPRLTAQDISALIEGLCSLFVSVVLLAAIGNSSSAKYLSLVFFSIAMTFISLGASIRGDVLGKITIGLGMKWIPVVLIHFIIVFIKEKGGIKLSTKYLKYAYGLIGLSMFSQLFYFLDLDFNYQIHRFQAVYELVFFSAGVLIDIIVVSVVYKKNKDLNPYISTLLRMIGIFFIISIAPIVCFSFLSKIVFGYEWINTEYTTWFILLFPLSFTYLLLSKKIYDIDLVVRRFALTTTLAIVPSLLTIGMISALFSAKAKAEHLILAFICTVTIISVTLYSLEYLTTRLERVVYPRRYYLQHSLKKIAKKLGLISSFHELRELILVDIIDILQVSGGAIVFKYNQAIEIISEGQIEHGEVEDLIHARSSAPSDLLKFELTRNQDYESYLVLTQKKSNTFLGTEETQWLNLITSYLSVSMENLFLIRKISNELESLVSRVPTDRSSDEIAWFRKLMFELQEKERFRIATDLHDTTMQDLFFLKRKLSALIEKYEGNGVDTEQAESLLEYIDVINMNLRQSCFELHPYLLQEMGLVRTIDKLVELERSTLPFHIEFKAAGTEFIESCDMEMKRHLFRVFQELVNNAKKHANATKVVFSIQAVNGKLTIHYRDDGVGFASGQAAVREIGGTHMGLEQIKSRVLSMRGLFEITSDKGRGMSFNAIVPLKEGMTA